MEVDTKESERGMGHEIDLEGFVTAIPAPIDLEGVETAIPAPIDLGRELPADVMPLPKPTSFFRQLYWTIYKNILLISRRPIMLFLMLFSSIISVLLAWAAGPNSDDPLPEFDDCGAVPIKTEYEMNQEQDYSDIKESLNDSWRNGLPVAVLSLGPFVQAVCAFLIVQSEIEKKLLGVLRVLGVRESVYWLSWYAPFFLSSLINSLLAAGIAKALPVHVFQAVYFGGIFDSLFFLQLALVAASFFLAALCGSLKRLLSFVVAVMILAVFVPALMISLQMFSYNSSGPPGLFWMNRNTTDAYASFIYGYELNPDLEYNDTGFYEVLNVSFVECENPIINEEQGTSFKTYEDVAANVQSDDIFLGCYKAAGFSTLRWNPNDSLESFGLASLYLVPYFHFTTMYSNFLGFTGMPDRTFTAEQAVASPEDLAVASSPTPMNEDNAHGYSLFAQGSTLMTKDTPSTSYSRGNREWEAWMEKQNGKGWDDEDLFYLHEYRTNIEYPHVCPNNVVNGSNFCMNSSCQYVPDSVASPGSPSTYDMLGYQVSLIVIYLLLASYWMQVFPAGNGARKSFYFFLVPSYWCGFERKNRGDENSPCIEMNNISKKFGSFQAVNNLTLKLRGGEVTALLGQNGAGKSTVINILSCEMPMTSGEVSVFGKSVVDPFAVRQLIGVCKQDDYLWPDLSAKEHLDIFGGLRGLDRKAHDTIVQKWLESVDLTVVKDKFSEAFSGGMKRRLSVALATIGDRPFVILDEPTTGMDPVSRRYVWKHLDEIKDRRVVLITTHAMEEADLLADEVAIMRKGELAAQGTPLELKSEHGSALQFSILVDKDNVQRTDVKIKDMFKRQSEAVSIWSSVDSGNITVKFERVDDMGTKLLTDFVSWLESDESDVTEYEFSNSSLEEVFIAITKDDDEPNAEHSESDTTRKGRCCFGASRTNNQETGPVVNADGQDFDPVNHISAFQPRLTVTNQVEAWMRQAFLRKWAGKRSIGEYIFFGILILGTIFYGIAAPGIGDGIILIPSLTVPALALSLMLPSIISPFYHDKTKGLLHIMQTQGLLERSFLLGTAGYAFAIQFIYGLVMFQLFYATSLFRETQMCDDNTIEECYTYDDGTEYCYNTGNWCWNRRFGEPYREYGGSIMNLDKDSNVEITASRTPGGYGTMILLPFIFALSTIGTSFASSAIPGSYKLAMVVVAFFTLIASFAPLANFVYFFYGNYYSSGNYYDYEEKEDSLTRCRLALDPLDLCDNLKNMTIGGNLTAEYYMNCIGLDVNGEGIYPSLCTPSYASLLPQFGVVQLLSMVLSSEIKFHSDVPGYIENVFIPQYLQGIECEGNVCKFPKIQSVYRENALYFLLGAVLLVILGTTIFMFIHFTPSFVVPFKLACSSHFSEAFGRLCCRPQKESGESSSIEKVILREVTEEKNRVDDIVKPLLQASELENVEDGIQPLGIDQKAKKAADDLPPIVMHSLRKVYPSSGRSPPKVALNSLDLHVPKGQVLGLLGKNGSGKSTCLKILSANHDPSGGIALVAGYDVSRESNQILGELGSCPQFDIIWPNLSVKNHLIFFARLKGLPRNQVRKAAHDVAKAVGLGGPQVYERNAGLLSGGMRRRLSIAISVLGAPRVLLLDEPTTGLDPSTRYEIWGLLGAFATDERAVIITTHMMIEADTLCDRIAIIAEGNLKVVATQQHLKNKYGSGYTLQLNLVRSSQAHQDMAMEFVRKHINEDAKLDHKQAKTLHISLPRTQSIGKVFKAMFSPERTVEGGINQFLLQQSSLEDVFITLG